MRVELHPIVAGISNPAKSSAKSESYSQNSQNSQIATEKPAKERLQKKRFKAKFGLFPKFGTLIVLLPTKGLEY